MDTFLEHYCIKDQGVKHHQNKMDECISTPTDIENITEWKFASHFTRRRSNSSIDYSATWHMHSSLTYRVS